jgi:hypothetical protein
MPRLRISGAIALSSPYDFISWTGTSLSIEQDKNKDLIISANNT